jgi:DNA polymerase III alpha subunit
MKYDKYGQAYTTEAELCDLLYCNPSLDLGLFQVEDQPGLYNKSVHETYAGFSQVRTYLPIDYKEDVPIELFHWGQQQNWYMPKEYKDLDIAKWLLDQCKTEPELQRVGHELLLYQARGLFSLLQYLKYFIDTMRVNNVVWGVGRGSSVASYVLYLLGVHRINSMYYDLDIQEFLK